MSATKMSADRIVLDGDPTVDTASTTRVHGVWHRGKKIDVAQ